MADQLYLSLWFPNFRLETLPAALAGVLRQFATVSGDTRVHAASAYPIDFTQSPTYQRVFVTDARAADTPDTAAAHIEHAVAEATEQLHEDMAYEFEMTWHLWLPDSEHTRDPDDEEGLTDQQDLDDSFDDIAPRRPKAPIPFPAPAAPEPSSEAGSGERTIAGDLWKRRPAIVRILGFGPEFDTAGYAQNGHIRIDFGLDTPWTFEADTELQASAASDRRAAATSRHIQQNVEMLLAFTLLIEKHCNVSSRLLWTESGEPLAEKLIAGLQRLH